MANVDNLKAGDQIKVFWEEDGEWFAGQITSYKPGKIHPYHVQYDDGDEEWVAFRTPGVLAALQSEDDVPGAEVLTRKFTLLTKETATETPSAVAPTSSQQPLKRKRGRPPGSGKKSKKAEKLAAVSPKRTRAAAQQSTQQAAKGQLDQPGCVVQPRSPRKKLRPEQQGSQQLAATGNKILNSPSCPEHECLPGESPAAAGRTKAVKEQGKGKGLRKEQSGRESLAASKEKTRGTQQSSEKPGYSSSSVQQASAALATNDSPSKVANASLRSKQSPGPALELPTFKPQRDPRKAFTVTGDSHGTITPTKPSLPNSPDKALGKGADSAVHASQQQQTSQPIHKPAGPPAVTVFGFQFSSELATVTGVAADEGKGVAASYAASPLERDASTMGLTSDVNGVEVSALGRVDAGEEQVKGQQGFQAEMVPNEEEIQQQVACRHFERTIVGLTRTKESIGRATGLALQAAKCNAGPRVVRQVLERISEEDSNQQRVNLLYLIDSILQSSVRAREGRSDCGPESTAGKVYPRAVGAALSQLVEAVARDAQAVEKLEKVLLIWQKKRIISDTLLRPALDRVRSKRTEHDAAWDVVGNASGTLAASLSGGAAALMGSLLSAQAPSAETRGVQPLREMQAALAMSGPEGQAALWRLWRRQPMDAVVQMKLRSLKDGSAVVLTSRQHSNEWEDMDALRAEAQAMGFLQKSPTRDDATSSAAVSAWESDSVGESPIPEASPWHWPMLREAKRNAAVAAAAQAQAKQAADEAATAAQAQQWMQLAASSKAHLSVTQRASGEPDEFDQEMLQQIAGAASSTAPPAQQDVWSSVSTLEAEATYGAATWSLHSLDGDPASQPPLPSDQPPLPPVERDVYGEQPPLPDDDDDFEDGPPPLPAYSPPADEYAPAEYGQPPLPAQPPPDDDMALDLLGASPATAQPPLPPGPAHPPGGTSPTPLLPPGIGVRRTQLPSPPLPRSGPTPTMLPPQHVPLPTPSPPVPNPRGGPVAQPPLQHSQPSSLLAALPATAVPQSTMAAVEGALAGLPVLGKTLTPRAVRNWTGFVTHLIPGSHGLVDHPGKDSGCFAVGIVKGAALQMGDRVQCTGEEAPSGAQHRWHILSIQKDAAQQVGVEGHGGRKGFHRSKKAGGEEVFEEHNFFEPPVAARGGGQSWAQLPPPPQQQRVGGGKGPQAAVSAWAAAGAGIPGKAGSMAEATLKEFAPHAVLGAAGGTPAESSRASQVLGYAPSPAGGTSARPQLHQQPQGRPEALLPPGWGPLQ